MRTAVTRTRAGYHGAVTLAGRVIALTLPTSDRNAAARAAVALARVVRPRGAPVSGHKPGDYCVASLTWHLVDETTGEELALPRERADFRGDVATLVSFQIPRHSGSTGRVVTSDGATFFPSVFRAKLVRIAG
jgi:hypothetical protein